MINQKLDDTLNENMISSMRKSLKYISSSSGDLKAILGVMGNTMTDSDWAQAHDLYESIKSEQSK